MREPYNRESRPARVEQHQVTQIVETTNTNNTCTNRFDEFPTVSFLHT